MKRQMSVFSKEIKGTKERIRRGNILGDTG